MRNFQIIEKIYGVLQGLCKGSATGLRDASEAHYRAEVEVVRGTNLDRS
jgi:hypothetical protein